VTISWSTGGTTISTPLSVLMRMPGSSRVGDGSHSAGGDGRDRHEHRAEAATHERDIFP